MIKMVYETACIDASEDKYALVVANIDDKSVYVLMTGTLQRMEDLCVSLNAKRELRSDPNTFN